MRTTSTEIKRHQWHVGPGKIKKRLKGTKIMSRKRKRREDREK